MSNRENGTAQRINTGKGLARNRSRAHRRGSGGPGLWAGLLMLAMTSATGRALAEDVSFSTQPAITTAANSARSVFAADIDGDGDMDVLSASFGDDKIAWYENDGAVDPTFTTRVITAGASGARSVFAADMDGDGDMDVLSASFGDDKIAWYENDGANPPGFTMRVITTGATGASSVFAADVDGDGDLDVLSASPNDNKIAWYENDGAADPTFSADTITTGANGARSVFAADVDGDGDLDVVSASANDDTIAWYQNDGAENPTFSADTITTDAATANSVFVADVDGDGDMDVLSASLADNKIAWYENEKVHRPTSFVTKPALSTTANGGFSVFAADLDADGDMDVLSASGFDDTIAWYENDGAANPTFSADTITTGAGAATSVFAADVDGDGDLDVLSASQTDNTIAWYENDGAANPTFSTDTITTGAGGAISVFAADLDSDGDMDVLSASGNDDTIAWYENDGSTTTPGFATHVITTAALGARSVFAADVDGDGDMDVLSASSGDATIAWYENDGAADPNFVADDITTGVIGARSVFAADVDGDGDMDVLSASLFGPRLAWYENDGAVDPNFTTNVIMGTTFQFTSVFAADVDSDGDVDVLSASGNDNTIAWYENDGATTPGFTRHVITTDANSAISVFAADVDSDGDMDVLSAAFLGNTIGCYENLKVNPRLTEWTGRSFAGLGGLGGTWESNATGLCMTVAAAGTNGVEWRSPLELFTVAQRTVYEVKMTMSTDQSTQGEIPIWDVNWINLQDDFFLNFGGRRWFIDTEGGAQGIGLAQGKDMFVAHIAPSAIDTPQWNGEGVFAGTGAFTTEASANMNIRLVIRILDFDEGLQSTTRSGTVCIENIEVTAAPLDVLLADTTELYATPLSSTTHRAFRGSTVVDPLTMASFDDMNNLLTLQLPTAANATEDPILATLGPDLDAEPDFVVDPMAGSVRNPLKRFPVTSAADTTYITMVDMYASSSESDPVDIIDIVNDAYTIEYGGSNWMTSGDGSLGAAGMAGAGSPKLLSNTGGNAPTWMDFVRVNNPTDSIIENSQRWRPQVDFFNQANIGISNPKDQTGNDELVVESLSVVRVN